MADVIRRSEGSSGTNVEYLFRLEDSLAGLGPGAVDRHVSGLVEMVKGRGEGEEGEGEERARRERLSEGGERRNL